MARLNNRWEKGDIATVFGGAGFLGRHTVEALAREGWRVCAAMRRPVLAEYLQPLGEIGQIYNVQANVRFPTSLRRAVRGAQVVVNLVGIQSESGRQTFEAVHVAGARAVAKAAREAGVKSLVHLSAVGAHSKSPSQFHRSKAAGEKAVREEFPNCVILRPAVMFGPEDRLFNRFATIARLLPFLPLMGGGRTRFQPVFVGDVAAAIATASAGRVRLSTVYELGGPEVITLRGLLQQTLQWSGRRRFLLYIPFWIAKLGAFFTAALPNMLRPFSFDQIYLLEIDNVVSPSAEASKLTLAGLGIEHPHTIELLVPPYLERFHPRGQFAHYHTLTGR
jgi:uncharacterized protein YbjT (DUF2867 family)